MTQTTKAARQAAKLVDPDFRDLIHQRVLSNIREDKETKCWVWEGAWTPDDLGRIRVGDRPYTVHRVVWWLFHKGFDLAGPAVIVHARECDTPACCNPRHLREFPGRAAAFAYLRSIGRWSTGRGPRLNQAEADRMRVMAATMSRTELKEAFGVKDWAVRSILGNRTYNKPAVGEVAEMPGEVFAVTGITGGTGIAGFGPKEAVQL